LFGLCLLFCCGWLVGWLVGWLLGLSGQDPPLGRWLHLLGSHPIGSQAVGVTGVPPCSRLRKKDAATRDFKELDERIFGGFAS